MGAIIYQRVQWLGEGSKPALLSECSECGAVVTNTVVHNDWHARGRAEAAQ